MSSRARSNRSMGDSTVRPRLLFLAHTLPFPLSNGVSLRTYNVLRLLGRRFEVTALCFYRRGTHPGEMQIRAGLDAISRFADVRAFPIDQEYTRTRFIRDHVTSLFGRMPYTTPAHQSSAFRDALAELLRARSFDLVHVDSLDLAGYLPMLDELPVVCVHHNVESELLKRRAPTETNPLVRAYCDVQARFLRAEERKWGTRVALNILVSEDDRRLFEELVPGARTAVVPNGVDTNLLQPAGNGGNGLVFVGGYGWYPNRDGLEYFTDEILPLIRERIPGIPVRWVGSAPDEVRERYRETHGIDLTGYVDDMRPIVNDAACFVVPLRVGGGTRLKILDAWALGKAVVSTSVGCEGLGATDGHQILIRDDPRAFAEAVCDVVANADLREALGRQARSYAEERFDWERLGERMFEMYHAAAGLPARQASDPAPAFARTGNRQ